MAAYGFLAAYAVHGMQQEQLIAKKMRLSALDKHRRELLRKRETLEQVRRFTERVVALKLDRQDWLFYDVNVQGDFNYDAAQQIIEQCSDSDLAYYWPLALEIKTVDKTANRSPSSTGKPMHGDVQLTVKGQFVARK